MNSRYRKDFKLKSFKDQDIFVNAVFSGLYKFLMYAGDIRSGKTIIDLAILVCLAKIYPGSRWCVIRKDRPTIIRNTLPTFWKYVCPPKFRKLDGGFNKSELSIEFINGSEIFFMSENIQDDPDLNRFKGLEVNGFLLEQAEELQQETFFICIQRAGQWVIDPMPPQLILLNCNPSNNWVKSEWYDKFNSGELLPPFYFQQADMNNNPHITEEYKQTLKESLPPQLYDRFCNMRWEAVDEAFQLNSWDDIYSCKESIEVKNPTKYLGVDVGHDGPDPSVWTIITDNIEKRISVPKTKIYEVAERTINIMAEEGIDKQNVCIDVVGLGAGVGDEMDRQGFKGVIKFRGGDPCSDYIKGTDFRFLNLRSRSNWLAREIISKKLLGNITYSRLISEAGAIKYEIMKGKCIKIMAKQEIKKKLKRSPDNWDSLTYAIWAKYWRTLKPMPGMFGI